MPDNADVKPISAFEALAPCCPCGYALMNPLPADSRPTAQRWLVTCGRCGDIIKARFWRSQGDPSRDTPTGELDLDTLKRELDKDRTSSRPFFPGSSDASKV